MQHAAGVQVLQPPENVLEHPYHVMPRQGAVPPKKSPQGARGQLRDDPPWGVCVVQAHTNETDNVGVVQPLQHLGFLLQLRQHRLVIHVARGDAVQRGVQQRVQALGGDGHSIQCRPADQAE